MKIMILAALAALMGLSAAPAMAQAYLPVDVTGFNVDVVAETAPISASTTGDMDGAGSALPGPGYPAATRSLPVGGLLTNATHQFQLQPYTTNNALRRTDNVPAVLTLVTPAKYTDLSVLVASGNGVSLVHVTIHYLDGASTVVPAALVSDWFTAGTPPFSGFGRVFSTGVFQDTGATQPTLTYLNAPVPLADQGKLVDAISVTRQTGDVGSVMNTFGVAGVAVVEPPQPVPTLSEWAMILLGVMLAGGAALVIQRRRMTA